VLLAAHSKADPEVFAFGSGAGTANVQVMGMPNHGSTLRSNMYLTLTIKDSNGNLVDSTTSTGGIASRSVNIPSAGNYYLYLQPVGAGDPAVNGFSNYASRGQVCS
jgi:hypothetical protein